MSDLAWAIRAARKAAGLSVVELAEAVGVGSSTVYRWEESRRVPGPKTLLRLERALSLDPGFLREIIVGEMDTIIQRQRWRLGMTPSDLARRVGVSVRQVNYWETGERPVSNRYVLRVAQVLDLSTEVLKREGRAEYAYWPTEKAYALCRRETV